MAATEQPKVVVKIPEVRLRLEDVTYLRSLTAPDGVQCVVSSEKKAKLILLGLVEEKNVPPTEKELKEHTTKFLKLEAEARVLFDAQKFRELDSVMWNLRNAQAELRPRPKLLLTETGLALLKTGTVTTKISKRGCL